MLELLETFSDDLRRLYGGLTQERILGELALDAFALMRQSFAQRLQLGYELIARQAGVPVVPVWMDQLWGSIFSFQGGRFFRNWPRSV